jgi:hypothetical protein
MYKSAGVLSDSVSPIDTVAFRDAFVRKLIIKVNVVYRLQKSKVDDNCLRFEQVASFFPFEFSDLFEKFNP